MAELPTAAPPSSSFGGMGSENAPAREKETLEALQTGVKPIFRFRGKDSGAPGIHYVYWTSNQTSSSFPGSPPYGGPIVDVVFRRVR